MRSLLTVLVNKLPQNLEVLLPTHHPGVIVLALRNLQLRILLLQTGVDFLELIHLTFGNQSILAPFDEKNRSVNVREFGL